jgi:hypothetical protein
VGLKLQSLGIGRRPVAAFLLASGCFGATEVAAQTPTAEVAAPSSYQIQRVGNQGIKLISKNPENSYAITVLGSNAEATNAQTLQSGEAWQKSVGVEVEGKLGDLLKTDLRTRFTAYESSFDAEQIGLPIAEAWTTDRRALEEFTFSTQFLGDRFAVSSSRRASDLTGLDGALQAGRGAYEQDRFKAWVWRSKGSSLSIEGSSSRVESGFQQNLAQLGQTKGEETQHLRSRFSYGRAGVFVGQRDTRALAPDQIGVLSHQSDIETGATVRLSDLRQGRVLALLPDSVWVSTNRGSVGPENAAASELKPVEKSSIGMSRNFGLASLNLSYWRTDIEAPPSASDPSQWSSRGMDVGGTLKSGPIAVAGNLSWSNADNIAVLNNTAERTLNGSVYLTWTRKAWPKLSAGLSNYAHHSEFLNYGGLEQSSMMRYEVAVDSSQLLSAWRDPQAQLKFIASYQENSSRSQWTETQVTGAENLFFGFKFSRSVLP